MRIPVYIAILCLTVLFGQDIKQMDQNNIDKMMLKVLEIQTCISKIDLTSLSALEEEAIKVQKEIEQMCYQGQRDQAQKRAMLFYTKVDALPAMIQMKKCTHDLISDTALVQKRHVCDGEKIDVGVNTNQRIDW